MTLTGWLDSRRRQRHWRAALPEEAAFWSSWLEQHGREWPEEYRRRLDTGEPLGADLVERLLRRPAESYRILDVGAGPISTLGPVLPGKRLEIVAVDPLAPVYDELLARHGVTPRVRTIACAGEALAARFAPESFDLVSAQNSLDHSYDPLAAIWNALAVLKTGCFLRLAHAVNEGENERYQGLHQWNFCLDRGVLTLWSARGRWSLEELLAPHRIERADGGLLTVFIEKRPDARLTVGSRPFSVF